MKKNLTFISILLAVGLFILLGIVLGRYASTTFVTEVPNAACAVTMTEVIASAQGAVYNVETFPSNVDPESYILATYSVNKDKIAAPSFEPVPNELKDEQKDSALQTEAWHIFTKLIPQKDRQMVKKYIIFTDGPENTLAAVDQVAKHPTEWIVEVDIADLKNKDALLFTLIHEYAHLLTLNASQVTIDQEVYDDPTNTSLLESKATACPNYFTSIDCSRSDSYVNAFYSRFWVGITPEWKKIDALQKADDLLPYYAGLYNFYLTHQDQFVDDYSTTHPTEDIAESFAYFIFSPKPAGSSIKEQKILFFYEYPELINLRQSILQGACATAQ